MALVGDLVTIVNRTKTLLEVVCDGVSYPLRPGKNQYPASLVRFAKNQYPLMGSENPYNPQDVQFLVGVKEWGDECSPLEPSGAIERMDRSQLIDEGARAERIPGQRLSRFMVAGSSQGDTRFAPDGS